MFPNFQYTTNNKQNNPYTPYNNQYQYNNILFESDELEMLYCRSNERLSEII